MSASPPNANACRTASRTLWRSSPNVAWSDGDALGARAAADQLLERDPLREEAHAVLIGVHGLIGSRSQVVRQYRRLVGVLARELAERPLPDTEAIYRLALDRTMLRSIDRAALLEADRTPVLRAVGH